MPKTERKDFFISYTGADLAWAEWVAWQLEEQKYSVILQTWDFRPGCDFVEEMDQANRQAQRTILILSNHALNSGFVKSEWHTAFTKDPSGERGILVPIRVEDCEVQGLLAQRVYIDLVGLNNEDAQNATIKGVRQERAKPNTPPPFPVSRSVVDHPSFPGDPPELWNVPIQRNPFFTGREQIITILHEGLTKEKAAALSQAPAITGLGGIGKTQIAIEYAYRYRHHYKGLFWVGSETKSEIISGFVNIAKLLNLPNKDDEDKNEIVTAVKGWLQGNSDWFIIFDNVEDFSLVNKFVPLDSKGRILFTTRLHATGEFSKSFSINKMEDVEGILFLLRRAKLISANVSVDDVPPENRSQAKEIYQLLDGLPLALDQAAAFIEKVPCSLKNFINLYKSQGNELRKMRGELTRDHPPSVTITFQLAFDRLELANTYAANILRLCAFLAPESIPEEIFSTVIQNPLQLIKIIREVCRFSLLPRDVDNKTYSVHRLIQEVLRDTMNNKTRRYWAERCVRVINELFPEVEFENWTRCESLLSHARAIGKHLEEYEFEFIEAGTLVNSVGQYLVARAQYEEAQRLFQKSLAIKEKVLGPEHADVATSLNNLAELHRAQGRYDNAEPLLQRSLAIYEKVLSSEHPYVATSLNNLAELHRAQGRYDEAKLLFQRSLAIREKVLGSVHPDIAMSLNNLAGLCYAQGSYDDAEPLFQRSLAIYEKVLGPEHPYVATSLNNLAELYRSQGRNDNAEPLFQRSLAIYEKVFGPEHPDVAMSLNNLALTYSDQRGGMMTPNLYSRGRWLSTRRFLAPSIPRSLLFLKIMQTSYGKQTALRKQKIC